MTQPLALIVDDEPDIRELLVITLSRMGVETQTAEDLSQAFDLVKKHQFQLCLVDMRLPDGDGIDLIRFIGEKLPQLPVAMITAHGNMETAIAALKAGAYDFVSKPVDIAVLRRLVETALKMSQPAKPASGLSDSTSSEEGQQLLGKSQPIEAIRNMIRKLARSQAPVYISGESGTGKELAARQIHHLSPRQDKPFVAVNCGAIPQNLVESELFGHVKGAFTGAVANNKGLFLAANGGTLFLDEIADLPSSTQVKLLRAIQEKKVRPVGGAGEISIDVRIISATHKDLKQLVQQEDFRQDLYFRINVIELQLPSLRERQEDIPLLIDHIINKLIQSTGQEKPRIDREALQMLYQYPFPGNVRELENTLERALTLCENNLIVASDLGLEKHDVTTPNTDFLGENQSLETHLANIEKETIVNALEKTHWNKTAAAKLLGISFRALRYRLEKLGLDTE